MRVTNLTSPRTGAKVANQFVIEDERLDDSGSYGIEVFQSYDSIIAEKRCYPDGSKRIILDEYYWDYSVTTGKYRNQFLGENKAETQAKIDCGKYELENLNKSIDNI